MLLQKEAALKAPPIKRVGSHPDKHILDNKQKTRYLLPLAVSEGRNSGMTQLDGLPQGLVQAAVTCWVGAVVT